MLIFDRDGDFIPLIFIAEVKRDGKGIKDFVSDHCSDRSAEFLRRRDDGGEVVESFGKQLTAGGVGLVDHVLDRICEIRMDVDGSGQDVSGE